MALYLISYDLIGKKFDQYEDLIRELERLGAKRILLSQWVWRGTNPSAETRDHLRKFMHANDRIVVCELTGGWAAFNALIDINQI
jgi:hypothetical protein